MEPTDAVQDQVFRALADGTRRALLQRLTGGEATVSALLAETALTQSAVSQHLKILRDANLVLERREGRHRYYRLRAEPLLVVRDWLAHYEPFWAERLERLGAVLRTKHGQEN